VDNPTSTFSRAGKKSFMFNVATFKKTNIKRGDFKNSPITSVTAWRWRYM